MKKIINNKVYDTETAVKVGEWDNGQRNNNLYWCIEELHRKRTGEFFLYGYGGPGSKYAVSLGDSSWSGGEKIIPLTYQAAQKWAETHLDGDKYEAIFGSVEEDDSRTMVAIYLPTHKAEQYKRSASKAGLSLTSYLESLLDKVITSPNTGDCHE